MASRRSRETDSDSSSSDSGTESDSSSDGGFADQEGKLIKKYTRKHGERKMKGKSNRAKHGSSYLRLTTQGVDQFASTPSSIFDELSARYAPAFGVKKLFDPCPEFYDKKTGGRINKPGYNGLKEDWGKINYVNPPYGQIKLWFPKAIEQQAKGNTSVFLVPLRPFTRYFVQTSPHISWVEVLYYGVGFKGYSGKIPHPMCNIVFLGKGVKDRAEFHMTVPQNKKINNFLGKKHLTTKIECRKHCYIQQVPKPCAFDNATEICEDHGIPKERIHIMINSSNMTNAGYLDPERIAKARTNWKHSYALLVPFYNYSVAFQVGMKEATILAYSSPILCNYAGEGKCRFCSVLFVFCPTDHKNFKAMVAQPNLHPFKMYFNFNGYLPTLEELTAAKMKKLQATKKAHMSKQRGVMKKQGRSLAGGAVTSNRRSKSAKKPARKTSAKKAKASAAKAAKGKASAKRARAKSAGKTASKKPATKAVVETWKKLPQPSKGEVVALWVSRFSAKNARLPTQAEVWKQFGKKLNYKKAVFHILNRAMWERMPLVSRGKRKGTAASGRPAKRRKVMATAGGTPQRSG